MLETLYTEIALDALARALALFLIGWAGWHGTRAILRAWLVWYLDRQRERERREGFEAWRFL